MSKRLLVVTQLSNYDRNGKFILECDSGWQMCMGRVREMLKLSRDLDVTVTVPVDETLQTPAEEINSDLWKKYGPEGENRLHYIELKIIPNALVTRYDFDWTNIAACLDLGMQKIGRKPRWDVVYLNDPMHLRALKAMFYVVGGYIPKFAVHSHFIDNPECPKFPEEASLWLGQCEAAIKADVNFWQCESSMNVFFESMQNCFRHNVVNEVIEKSYPWDDGYSSVEINQWHDVKNVRFSVEDVKRVIGDKVALFVPNRIGGRGRSSDYTNCGKFMFEILPRLRELRDDFVVFAGNPSQKFSNRELVAECGQNGYVSLTETAFNRDEYRLLAKLCHISVGLYDQDSYGGTAARELVDLGLAPLWIDNYEYASLSKEAGWTRLLPTTFGDEFVAAASRLIDDVKENNHIGELLKLQDVVRRRCSYEMTTRTAMERMWLL